MKKLLFTLLAAAAVVGCAKEEGYTTAGSSDVVKFSSESISTRTNAAGTEWIENDYVGIYSSGFAADYANVKYYATIGGTTTTFEAVTESQAILYPNVDSSTSGSVKFYAYYPYSTAVSSRILEIDIADQSDFSKIDFMVGEDPVDTDGDGGANVDNTTVSDYGVGADANDTKVTFEFNHKLSKVIFDVTAIGNLDALTGLEAEITGIETKGSYVVTTGASYGNLSEQESVELEQIAQVGSSTTNYTVTAILHPGTYTTPQLKFTVGSKIYVVTFGATLEAGKAHTYYLSLGNEEAKFTGDNSIGGWDDETTDGYLYPVDQASAIAFADANFKSALLSNSATIDSNSDGEISYTEAEAFTGTISIGSKEISSMAEIKYFPNITSLSCHSNSLTELDLSALTALTSLYCNDNSITKLDLSACTGLRGICCYSNRLSELDVTMCPNIGVGEGSGNYYESNFLVGHQTSDGSTSQDITVYVTTEQQGYIDDINSGQNTGVTLSTEK